MHDFRSDTVTRPTPAMREAIARAEVGDDVMGEDPTVNALEAAAAARFGHEAALFCPSGTMTNQIAIHVHTRPGDEIVVSGEAHVHRYEGGGIAATSGVAVHLVDGDRGRFTAADVRAAVKPDDPHYPRTRLVAVEDTVNRGGGAIWDVAELKAIRLACDAHGLALHLDGARVCNRLVATGDDPRAYGALFDSISVCLSKGLGAPVGSVLLGSADFIHGARRVRKRLGGGMRQAGLLAAAGLHALEHHVDRLADDHRRARALAEALASSPDVAEVVPPDTNLVIVRLAEGLAADDWLAALADRGILAGATGPGSVRFALHLDLTDDAVAAVVDATRTPLR